MMTARPRDAEESTLAAAPEALSAGSGMPLARRRSGERLWAVGGVLFLVLVAVGLRLVPTVFVPSMNWGDEVFQTIEPAHRLVYGYGLVTWEFQLGMRSWLLPGALAGLIEVGRLIGDGPEYYLVVIAVALGVVASGPVICCFLWCRRWYGLAGGFVAAAAVAVAPELMYFGARALNEVVAGHLLVVALYLAEPGYPANHRRRLFAAGLVFGIVALLRLQLAPVVAVVALASGLRDCRTRLPALIGGGLAALLLGTIFDWLTLGYPLASVWRNLFYNVHLGISSGFSVEPWYFYFIGELGVWLTAAPILLLLVGLGCRRMPLLVLAIVAILAVHLGIAHKEYRFIYPAVVLASVLAAFGLAELASRAAHWLARRGLRRAVAASTAALLLSGVWTAIAFGVWSNGALALLRHRDHDELRAISYVRELASPPCGLGLYGEEAWVRYGGYTWLHQAVPMFWPKDEAALAEASPGFDTLVTDRPPPASFGFRTLRCFGEICALRRPGRCEAGPMPPMWFPAQLRGSEPAAARFEALPNRGGAGK